MLKLPNMIVTALSLTLAFSLAPEVDTRVFRVLVAPGEGVSSGAFSNASDLVATLDKQPYTIRSAEPLRPGEGKTVIVVDFDKTSPTNHACLLAEALSAMERIRESPPPLVLTTGPSPFTSFVRLGPNREFNIFAGGDLKAITNECETGRASKDWVALATELGGITSDSVFYALQNNYAAHDAPVRVFWLSEEFAGFASWKGGYTLHNTYTPPFLGIERVAEADLTFFPVVFGKRHKGRTSSPLPSQVQQAGVLAESTGGFVSSVSGKPGDTLARAFEITCQGVVLTLEGPVTADGLHPAKAEALTIQGGGVSPLVTWQRRFVVNQEGSVRPPLPGLLVPLIVPTGQLALRSGCQAPGSSSGERTLEVTLPSAVVKAPTGQVEIYIEYPNEKRPGKQGFGFERMQGVTRSLCLPLTHARDGMKFRVLVIDRASGWVGAADGVLRAEGRQ
jgi:hypothetical protein